LVLGLAVGCGEEPAPSQSDTSAVTRGGVLRYASLETTNIDPAVASTGPDYQVVRQIYDYLVELDENFNLQPALAESWETPDAKSWTLKLRPGVVFHDGSSFDAADVIYTFERLADPATGSPLVDVFANIDSMEAVDAQTVVVNLKKVDAEFALGLTQFQAAILPEGLTDPADNPVGTGAFMLDSLEPQIRAVFKANPDYWRKDASGEKLPYLDGMEMVYIPELAGQVEALRGGEVDFVGGLSYEQAEGVKGDPSVKLLTVQTNQHYSVHMRCDQGSAKDPNVRLALRLGTDTTSMAEVLRPGLATAGNGTLVGPTFTSLYVDQAPPYDPEKAKQLLADAGYADGLDITIQAQNAWGVPGMATVWQEQMKKIGVNVDIQVVPADVYYGEGKNNWLDCDFGITDWGQRASPLMYFQLEYITGAPWSGSKWSDAEFDAVCKQIQSEVDDAKRAELYRTAQQILIERQPVIILYFEKVACATAASVQDVTLDREWDMTSFDDVWMTQ
jgi:peptide/nickel transport system substrate-binding protein